MFDLVTLVPTFVSACLGAIAGVIVIYVKMIQRFTALETKQDVLIDRVDRHNHFAERLPVIEHEAEALRKDVDEVFVRLRAVETKGSGQ